MHRQLMKVFASHTMFTVHILYAKHSARATEGLPWRNLQPKLQRGLVRWAVPDIHSSFTCFSSSQSRIHHKKS